MTIDPWHIVGGVGTLVFAGRWVLQVIESRAAGKPVVTKGFWYMSISGSVLTLAYFTFGHRDPVGIMSNLFPATIAIYNLILALGKKEG